MPAFNSVTCPGCKAVLRMKEALPAGVKIKCPRCAKSVVIPEGSGIRAVSKGASNQLSGSGIRALPKGADNPAKSGEMAAAKTGEFDRAKTGEFDSVEPKSGRSMMMVMLIAVPLLGLPLCCGVGGLGAWLFYEGGGETASTDNKEKPAAPADTPNKGIEKEDNDKKEKDRKDKEKADKDRREKEKKDKEKKDKEKKDKEKKNKPPDPVDSRFAWKEYTSAKGKFRVLFPAPPIEKQAPGPLGNAAAQVVAPVDGGLITFLVSYEDHATDPRMSEQAYINQFKPQTKSKRDIRNGKTLGAELVVEMIKDGVTRIMTSRVFLVGTRLYHVAVTSVRDHHNPSLNAKFLESFQVIEGASAPPDKPPPNYGKPNAQALAALKAIPPLIKDMKTQQTDILGGAFEPDFVDAPPEGALLIGFEVGLGTFGTQDIVTSIVPIYVVNGGEKRGGQHGVKPKRIVTVKAKPGYAVGGLLVKAGLVIDGFAVQYMEIDAVSLVRDKTYKSDWVGGIGGGAEIVLGGDGSWVVGICGKKPQNNEALGGIGLVLAKP